MDVTEIIISVKRDGRVVSKTTTLLALSQQEDQAAYLEDVVDECNNTLIRLERMDRLEIEHRVNHQPGHESSQADTVNPS